MNDPLARSKDVFELNRLWVHDSLPRNTESQFVGWYLRQIKRVHPNIILISYADGSRKSPDGRSHVGIVYQATNWTSRARASGVYLCVDDFVGGQNLQAPARARSPWLPLKRFFVFALVRADSKLQEEKA